MCLPTDVAGVSGIFDDTLRIVHKYLVYAEHIGEALQGCITYPI